MLYASGSLFSLLSYYANLKNETLDVIDVIYKIRHHLQILLLVFLVLSFTNVNIQKPRKRKGQQPIFVNTVEKVDIIS